VSSTFDAVPRVPMTHGPPRWTRPAQQEPAGLPGLLYGEGGKNKLPPPPSADPAPRERAGWSRGAGPDREPASRTTPACGRVARRRGRLRRALLITRKATAGAGASYREAAVVAE